VVNKAGSKRIHSGGFFIVLMAAASLMTAATAMEADPPAVAERCIGCHNENGVTDNPQIPTIAGAGSFFLQNQLEVFSAGARPCVVDAFADEDNSDLDKCAFMATLSDEQKTALAEYFGKLQFEPFEQEFDADLARQGASIHAAGCERCHTNSGSLSLDDAGILAGQPIPYLIRQLKNYENGTRWQPESMARETQKLNEDKIRALAHFYAGQGQ